MKWSTIQLQKYRGKNIELDEMIDVSAELMKRDSQVRDVSPIHVTGIANITTEKVTFHLHIHGKLILPCARTLKDVPFPIDIESTEIFLLKPEQTFEDDEAEVHRPIGEMIDLNPIITELLLLEIPMQVFSEEAKDDSDLPSGNDWEVVVENQDKPNDGKDTKKIDPRLAGLAKFFDKEES
ncbi:YceD family protein [Heyndrickxia camelliae]|uniref:DUF177 domain-containing protein n=1 Tax=Heyndrickxia camelliae TaxID=1707093 RepID=A0A2N3LQU5_9BACI|nr:DUF177 domain-containing protein [Heyndrickxia camelliae]PKR86949.1 hypothetical protein CWO92_02545 [Heyndrickxia camelliae]